MYTIVGAILLVASFGTYNIISTITHEKTRDIAILKSLGFRDRTIRAIFIFEALLVGLVGAALGWIFGYLLTRGLASLEFKTPFSDYNHLPVIYSAKHYLLATARGAGCRAWWQAISRPAPRRGFIPSTSSGARHEHAAASRRDA